jgi:hypothetical protein
VFTECSHDRIAVEPSFGAACALSGEREYGRGSVVLTHRQAIINSAVLRG